MLAIVAVVLHAGWVARKRNEGDLRVYHDTVARLPAGLDLYHAREGPDPERLTGFIYPLTFALAFAPLTFLEFGAVRVIWALLMGLAAVRALALSLRLAFPEGVETWVRAGPTRATRAVALGLGVFVALRFALSDIQHGQANVLMVWLALEGIALAERPPAPDATARRRREAAAGALLAAAASIKLTPGLLVAGYLLDRRWRLVAWSVIAGIALVLVAPAIVLGPSVALEATWRFATEITPWNARTYRYVGNNASLSSLIDRLLVGCADAHRTPEPMLLALAPETARVIGLVASAAVFVASLAVSARLVGVFRSAFLFAAIPLISPVAWKPHLVGLTLPAIVGARAAVETSSRTTRAALALAAAGLLGGREVIGRELADLATRWGVTTLGIAALALGVALAGTCARDRFDPDIPPPTTS